jgi:serine/threonine-protein kinase
MGDVWEAEDRELEGPCAVKFILHRMMPDRAVRSRFAREAKVAARLRSPHAVQILGVGEHEGAPYLAMELLEGEALDSFLAREGALDAEATLTIVGQVAGVLEKARELDIVHRDLKPANIWLCAQRSLFVKVFDFGIAKAPLATVQTASGALVGTPHYMSPEQVKGGRTLDHRSDLWALAVVALECLTARRPFEGEGLGELVLKIVGGADASVRELASSVAPGLGDWAARALAADPNQRFQSASELVEALRSRLLPGSRAPSGAPVAARVSATRTPPSRMDPAPPVARSRHGSGFRPRGRTVLALLSAPAAVLVRVGLCRAFGGGSASSEAAAWPSPTPSVKAEGAEPGNAAQPLPGASAAAADALPESATAASPRAVSSSAPAHGAPSAPVQGAQAPARDALAAGKAERKRASPAARKPTELRAARPATARATSTAAPGAPPTNGSSRTRPAPPKSGSIPYATNPGF